MKKVLFILVLVVGLQGSECDYWMSKFKSTSKLIVYAADRGANDEVVAHSKKALRYIERVGAECVGTSETIIENSRTTLKNTIVRFGK